jgi:glucose-1-phosphate thymidylyltransferase
MKGIILAGGNGTRLQPTTIPYSKQLLPVYDKPLIYYPLSTLMNLNIREILIIVKSNQLMNYRSLLGDGKKFGLKIKYAIQNNPNGIAEALIIGKNFIKNDSVALILGDNIFYGHDLFEETNRIIDNKDGTIFLYEVKNASQYGVANFKNNKLHSIIEKPKKPKSKFAVTGLYIYNKGVTELVKNLKPSKRGELEITDLNNLYIKNHNLDHVILKNSSVWFDAGTASSLLSASQYIQAIQDRNNSLVSSPEQIAYEKNFISKSIFLKNFKNNIDNQYYQKLKNLIK